MRGREHYRRAAVLLSQVENGNQRDELPFDLWADNIRLAQAHATLALASATAHAQGGAAQNASEFGP